MLEIKNVSVKIKDKYLIKNLSVTVNKKDKLAIIGEEGNGKSTLLKCLLGKCEYAQVTGTIHYGNSFIGYLEQTIQEEVKNQTVYDYLFPNESDYYSCINDFYKFIKKLKVKETVLNQMFNTLSGGEKVKIGILKLLLKKCDILFLDEPTNDLDIESLKWLEQFIQEADKPIIYVSHDETLLENTANMILHIEQLKHKTECHHTLLKTDYNTYLKQRISALEKQNQVAKKEKRELEKKQKKLKKVMQKVEYQQNTITRKDPHGAKVLKKKMHSLKSQEKKLENKNRIEKPDIEENIQFFFENVPLPKTKTIIQLEKSLIISDIILIKNIKLEVLGKSHVCIVGKNGIGKSTLLKEIKRELETRTDLKIGYMPQRYEDILDKYENVLDFLCPGNKEEMTKIRMFLGNMHFTKEEMMGKIKELSGGSKAKLFLVKLVVEQPNVLLLDEPTRNVSPLSNPKIREALNNFTGAIISVSHDRKYIEENDKVYELTENGLIEK